LGCDNGGELHVVFLGKGCREEEATTHTYCRAGKDIPYIVPAAEDATPRDIGAEELRRNAPLPAITLLQKGGASEGKTGMVRRE
jgi:hypothetical protein